MGKLARRAFLIGSAAIAGGVAFGGYMVMRDLPNPLEDGLGEGEASFNPFVKIGPAGIVLIAPHTDLGQGVRHIQAMLIAEELDLEPGQFTVETGPPAAAYWNSGLGAEAEGFEGSVLKIAGKLLGLQITGGSSTVPDSFMKLREAGAVARETLKKAAARLHDVPASDLKTVGGSVVLPDGTAIAYTDLAREAAGIDPVTDVALRDPKEWRHLGKDMLRLDMVGKSTGTLEYGIDIKRDDMAFATVRLNPAQGAALKRCEPAAALAMPGVREVLEIPGGIAVLADNTWAAMQAAQAVECEWAEADYLPDAASQWEALGDSFGEDQLDKEWRADGHVAAVLSGSEVWEAEYRTPFLAHAPLEPLGATILATADRADIWVAHQVPRVAQQKVAEILGLDDTAVHLHNQYVGGSFGHRLEFENVNHAAQIAKQARGVPIKLTYSREEDFVHDFPRQPSLAKVRGAVAGGKVTALDISVASPAVGKSQMGRMGMAMPGPDSQITAGIHNAPYAIPNMRVAAYAAQGLPPTSSWRSVGASNGGFILESALDELIHAAGADPLEERLRLVDDPVARKVLETVGEMSGWGSELAAGSGRGVALVESFGVPVAQVVEVSSSDAGIKLERVWVAADVGKVLDPVNFENLVQGGVIFGLGHAMNCEITYAGGAAEQTNFHAFEGMRMRHCPQIVVKGLENGAKIRGIGEPPVPPAAPALANAIFAATGQRLREMPFSKSVAFA